MTRRGAANLHALAELAAAVRFVHPSDQAQAIAWQPLLLAGIRGLEDAQTSAELGEGLRGLIEDVAPTVVIWRGEAQAEDEELDEPACAEDEADLLEERGYLRRLTYQPRWENPGYADFEAFLATLTSRKRKQIRKERRRAQEAIDGAAFVAGPDISHAQLDALDRFYRRTTNLYGGRQYLRPGFFEALLEEAPERVRFYEARQGGAAVGGALFFETAQGLYGRYWGCEREIQFLHFEAAYYAGIQRCIELGLPLFEAGAQGEHKLLRGFMPSPCHSAHWMRHPAFDRG
ncbi:MAG: GNAT family N-acetyltransferase, partial [Myxococcales bacterium]|nr:GNAT family N-acetyltransferase [Myxococcales bacterium]